MHNKTIGVKGELIALNYLKEKGYKILEKNVKIKYKEIDIIAKIKGKIVFVEVKTRTTMTLGGADAAMSSQKLHHLKKAIGMYVNFHKNLDPNNVRLDLICIDINQVDNTANIKHIIDIF